MTQAATGTRTTTLTWEPWQPVPFVEPNGGPMLMRGSVRNHYTGRLEAVGTLETLVTVHPDGRSPMIGLERVDGTLDGRRGTFVVRLDGVVENGTATATLTVVPGSGTGELAGISGSATYVCRDVGPDGRAEVTLDVRLD